MPLAEHKAHRPQTPSEEIANSVSHGVGFLLALAALPVLVIHASPKGVWAVFGSAVFGVTVALLYLSSTLHHALRPARPKYVFEVLDHSAIYLVIAGTYTPFMLGVLRGPWGWSLLAVIWPLAIAGVVLKSTLGMRHPRLSLAVYLAMGWLIVIAAPQLWQRMSGWGLFWIAAGGIAYTLGTAFYSAPRLRYAHLLWHLSVLAGTACHFIAVLRYSA